MAAGFSFDSNKGIWVVDQKTRQDRVWKQIENYENRSGVRATSSLTQIMDEDSEKFEIQQKVSRGIRDILNVYPKQNGVLIALDGKPLLSAQSWQTAPVFCQPDKRAWVTRAVSKANAP